MKDLTPQQISSIWHAQSASGGRSFEDIIRAAIKADRDLNGRTGEEQPAREWVGLTDVDRAACGKRAEEDGMAIMYVVEDMLREKNAGQPAAYEGSDQQRLDDLVHALTGDEGDDDSFKVLERVVAELNGRTVRDLLAEDKAGGEPVACLTKEQADRIVAALDVTDAGWSVVADFVRSLQFARPQPQAEVRVPEKKR